MTHIKQFISGHYFMFGFLLLIVFLSFLTFYKHSVYALSQQVCPAPAGLPCDVGDYFASYDNQPNPTNMPATDVWLSPAGQSSNDSSVTVSYGIQNVNLQINTMTFLHHLQVTGYPYYPTDGSPNGYGGIDTMGSYLYIYKVTPSSGCVTSNPAAGCSGSGYPGGASSTWGPYSTTRFWSDNPISFYYVPSGGRFVSTMTVTMTMHYEQLEDWYNTWYCVINGTPISGNPGPGSCDYTTRSFTITINVTGNPPVSHLDSATCTNLSGWTFDPNDSSVSLNVDIYVNGPASPSQPGHRYLANVYRPDVNAAYGITGNHGFQIDPSTDSFLKTYAQSDKQFTVYLYAIGVNSSGQKDGDNPLIGTATIGPCGSSGISSPCPQPASYTAPVYLPNAPNPGSSGGPGAPTTTPGQYYVEGTPGELEITASYDQYGQFLNSSDWSPDGYTYSHVFTLNYMPYILDYPYDNHQSSVNYTQQYTMQWYETATSPSYYVCEYGGSLSGSTCTITYSYTVTNYASPPCPSGYQGPNNGLCSENVTYTYSYSYPATAFYDWHTVGSPYTDYSSSSTMAPYLKEWCPRNFTVMPPPKTDVTQVSLYGGTPDQPNQATVQTQTSVEFYLNDPWPSVLGIRHPFQVNGINYIGTYYIEHADGLPPTLVASPDFESLNVGSTYQQYSPISTNYSKNFTVSMPPLQVGDQICAQFTDSPESGTINEFGRILSGSGSVQSTQIPNPPTCSGPVSNEPYVRAYGNDVAAGIEFNGSNNSCQNGASIIANPSPDQGPRPRGSGSQFAAVSLGSISNFATAFLRSATETAINGLTLANTYGGYGGNYAYAPTGCQVVYNYYGESTANNTGSTIPVIGAYNINSAPPTVKLNVIGGYVTLQGNNINGEHVIYVNGNVYISSNITYNNSAASYNANTGKLSNIPGLFVIASGNIYIGPKVTSIDGVYVAENQCDYTLVSCSSGSGGVINTCADINNISGNSSGAYPPSQLFSSCEQQLYVKGALMADTVKLERTYSSMRSSQAGENPLTPMASIHSCDLGSPGISPPSAPDCASQIFDFNPINYLGNPQFSSNNNYDSIISLPPVL